MKPFAAVLRVSFMGERKEDSDKFHATDDQMEDIEVWRKRRGVRVEYLRPFELDVSGGLPIEKRPQLLKAVQGVEEGRYAGVVVAYLSRFGRTVEQLQIWDRIEAAGGEVVAVQEGIDKTTMDSHGKLHRNILTAINAHEREIAAERWDRRRRIATGAGIWQSHTPTGYTKREDRRLFPDPIMGPKVTTGFADFLTGRATVIEIADRLDLSPSGVRQLLRNRVFLGEVNVGKYARKDAHPPLVDQTTFDAVQRKLAEGIRPPRSKSDTRRKAEPALLAGLVRCAACGHLMPRARSTSGNWYKCRKHYSGFTCPSPSTIRVEELDRHVIEVSLPELDRIYAEASESNDEIASIQIGIEEREREFDTYIEAVSAADIGAEAFAKGAKSRNEAIEAEKDRLYQAMARQPAAALTGSAAEIFWDLEVHEQNTLLRGLLAAVVVKSVGRGRRTPAAERTRVLAHGADVDLLPGRRGCKPQGFGPIPFPNSDAVGVLGVPAGQDRLEHAGSVG